MTMQRYIRLLHYPEERTFLENIGRAWEVWRSGGSDWAAYIMFAIRPSLWARRYGR